MASTFMPWATYENLTTHATTEFRGGGISVLLGALGVAGVALSLLLLARTSLLLRRAQLAVGCAALGTAVVLYLSKISAANRVLQEAPSRTSFGFGAVVGVVSAAVLALTSLRASSAIVARTPSGV